MSGFLVWFYPGDTTAIAAAAAFVQIAVVIVVAAAAARLLKRRAALRHAIWFSALGCVLVSPLLAVLAGQLGVGVLRIESPHSPAIVEAESNEPLAARPPTTAAVSFPASSQDSETAKSLVPPALDPASAPKAPTQISIVSKVPDPPVQADSWRAVGGALVLAWAVGAAFLLLRLLHGIYSLARLRRGAAPLNSPRMKAVLDAVRRGLSVEELPQIGTSPLAPGPAATGVFLPCVLLPEGMIDALDDRQLSDVLIHECAHVLRRDPLIGLLQRLAGAFLWPHPLFPYLNRRLSRAREEVCDDYVLRAGDAPTYARTLLMLSENSGRVALAAPGLIDPNWKLEDRVAGLLDPRRSPMTRVHPFTFACLAATLLAACTAGAVVCTGGEPAKETKPAAKETKATDALMDPSKEAVEGVVVDEAGKPVAAAVVRFLSYLPPPGITPVHTAINGSFRLVVDAKFAHYGVIAASTVDGARQGIFNLLDTSKSQTVQARIVVKPFRPMTVRVTDAANAPMKGAAVGVLDYSLLVAQAETDANGQASLRLPRDAHISQVVALKPGSGCDYFENYRIRGGNALGDPPVDVVLKLDGARSLSVRAVDSAEKPLAGIDVGPWIVQKKGKITGFYCSPQLKYVASRTDHEGFASFEWIPTDLRFGAQVFALMDQFKQLQAPSEDLANPSKTVVLRLLREVRISGKATLPDGKPAANILIQMEGHGDTIFNEGNSARTQADGTYSMLVCPNLSYIIGMTDENWAAPSKTGIFVKEGEPRAGVDFHLSKGTVLRGRVTTGPHDRPAVKKQITVIEVQEGGELPLYLGSSMSKDEELDRRTETDADGRYEIRVGPGRYVLANNEVPSHRREITVKTEETVETDLKIDALNRGVLNGVVLAGGLDGKPVREAFIKGESEVQGQFNGGSFEHEADAQGRFNVERERVKASVYARNPTGTLATIVTVGEDDDNATILLSDAGQIKGRLVDASGKPVADKPVDWFLHIGSTRDANPRASLRTMTDDDGRFTLLGVVPGAECQISIVPSNRIQHLKTLPITKVETLDVGDLVCDPNG